MCEYLIINCFCLILHAHTTSLWCYQKKILTKVSISRLKLVSVFD
ncbi:hypothetical protein A1OE_403 [Candidatus Endolissoclinum faulkneri L2]|uniref:Uncharacterized protein n=1 Tax=Candidatus Endolissoclinum faulkneri L2 TaxID=1193729 RepID=K7YM65_9PROT|nr:hypothetical protein A1OE_403 [Candidatus Endolissoclinum faulkneri L2]